MCGCMDEAGAALKDSPQLGMYSLSENAIGFGLLVTPNVNTKDMSASVTISTSRRDRQRERVLADGLDINQYVRNPVVLWEHGLDSSIPLPIGKSKSPSGEVVIKKTGDAWDATCWFSQTSPSAYQIFGLVAEDIVRAASIQALPYPSSITREVDIEDGLPNVVIGRAELVEWSWGRMGINPDAVRKCLGRGRIGEHKMIGALVKSLSAMLPPKKIVVPGIGDGVRPATAREITLVTAMPLGASRYKTGSREAPKKPILPAKKVASPAIVTAKRSELRGSARYSVTK